MRCAVIDTDGRVVNVVLASSDWDVGPDMDLLPIPDDYPLSIGDQVDPMTGEVLFPAPTPTPEPTPGERARQLVADLPDDSPVRQAIEVLADAEETP